MSNIKTKSIKAIEEKLEGADVDTIRRQVLQSAKDFKTSWIDLGQALYAVWKDKMYKDWGFTQFDTYTAKEIGIRKQTALKLLKSYYFLEREEPLYLKKNYSDETTASTVPSLESVDMLRLANQKKTIDRSDYDRLRKSVFEKGKDAREVKKDLTALIRERQELDPDEAWKKKRQALVKRFMGSLKSIRNELKSSKMLPVQIGKDIEKLLSKLEVEIS